MAYSILTSEDSFYGMNETNKQLPDKVNKQVNMIENKVILSYIFSFVKDEKP